MGGADDDMETFACVFPLRSGTSPGTILPVLSGVEVDSALIRPSGMDTCCGGVVMSRRTLLSYTSPEVMEEEGSRQPWRGKECKAAYGGEAWPEVHSS